MDVSEVEDLLHFQSTLPVRGATHFVCDSHVAVQDFNPRSP